MGGSSPSHPHTNKRTSFFAKYTYLANHLFALPDSDPSCRRLPRWRFTGGMHEYLAMQEVTNLSMGFPRESPLDLKQQP